MSVNKPHHEADENAVDYDEAGKLYTFPPRALNIVWGNDNRYWSIVKNPNTSQEVAELKQVSWLEVTGTLAGTYDKKQLKPGMKLRISFEVSLKSNAYGWSTAPVFLMAKIGRKGKYNWKRIKSINDAKKSGTPFQIPDASEGHFEVEVLNKRIIFDDKLYFGLYEVWSGKWKAGLVIHKALVQDVTPSRTSN